MSSSFSDDPPALPKKQRLVSLDVFRGLTVAGMIFVNFVSLGDLGDLVEAGKLDAKSWLGQIYLWIDHAPWHDSWNLADFVFPFFLYIVGVAMAYSFTKYRDTDRRPNRRTYGHILSRVAWMMAIGLLINGLVYSFCKIPKAGLFDFEQLRLMGVLQRIALAYGAAAVIVLNLPKKAQWATAGLLLVGYWIFLAFVAAPDAPADPFASGAALFDDKRYNFASYIDRALVPLNHLHKSATTKGYDPEGIFSTLPAIVSVLLGYFNGVWLKERRMVRSNNSTQMAMFGLAAIVVGRIWGSFFPINKNLWTSSFVLFMAGWALLLFALCYELVDVRGIGRTLAKPLEWMGRNPLVAFVGSIFMIKIIYFNNMDGCGDKATSVYKYLVDALFGWSGPANSVVLFALFTVFFWNLMCFWMYRMKWFIKL
jgi:predicted acyltransferase